MNETRARLPQRWRRMSESEGVVLRRLLKSEIGSQGERVTLCRALSRKSSRVHEMKRNRQGPGPKGSRILLAYKDLGFY